MSDIFMTRRRFLKAAGLGSLLMASGPLARLRGNQQPEQPNILLLTADDMNWNAPTCFGGRTPGVTPNIDRLASEGVRFEHAHITIAVCQPSRSVLMTGRYPHRNGAEGFQPINTSIPTLQEQLHKAGYLNGILGKVTHLAPREKFKWDMVQDFKELGNGRNPKLYYKYARSFFGQATDQGKPFFLMANSHDPHRPFHGSAQEQKKFAAVLSSIPAPSRVYKPEEVEVPGFLPDLPDVRKEIAQYYCSVRRCDDTVGAVMRALRESGQAGNTLVMFLSDNGMALPFAKTNCYLHSTRTPWIAAWPGKTKPGSVDDRHFISGIDFMPTALAAAGLPQPEGMDGSSFLPILLGEKQPERDKVFTQFHQTSGRNRYPMRCVQNRRFGYIFNPWSDGQRIFKNESQSGLTFNAMKAAAEADDSIATRVRLFQYRVVEEFYDFENDPDALHNLIDDPRFKQEIENMRQTMRKWMKKTGDPALEAFENHDSKDALKKFMTEQDAKSGRKQPKAKKKTRKTNRST
ncbi:MAG: sulfatase-like hydrolase/transferase [Phycisphaerales bacterium]|nr:MAG: sulfatase-like hydrolase/transferase [Phycisphaerales bacterium]